MEGLCAWLLTYLLHSTVLLGAAAALRLVLRERRLVVQEAVLRAALVGGFVTASLQVGLGLPSAGGIVHVPGVEAPLPRTPSSGLSAAPGLAEASRTEAAAAAEPAGAGLDPRLPRSWRGLLLAAWGGLAGIGSLRLLVAALRLRRLLSGRRPLEEDGLRSTAAGLAARLGLRGPVSVTVSPRIAVPLARGVLRPEVCLPPRIADLGEAERVALIAHELAHLARRDPAWIVVAHAVSALAPLQPLNAWARRRLQAQAESLSDDLAIAASGQRTGLARSLLDVATWTLAARFRLGLAAGAFGARSRLGHRVERIMDPVRALERPRRGWAALAAGLALATAFLTPVVSGGSTAQETDEAVAEEAAAPPDEAEPLPRPPAAPAAPVVAPEPPEPPEPADPSGLLEPPEPPEPALAPEPPSPPEPPLPPDLERQLEGLSAGWAESAEEGLAELHARIEALAARRATRREEVVQVVREVEQRVREMAQAVAAREQERLGERQHRVEEAVRVAAERAVRRDAELGRDRQELHQAVEELRRAAAEARQAAQEARRAAEEARRAADEALRSGSPRKP